MSFKRENATPRRSQSTFQKWLPFVGLLIIIGFFGSVKWSSDSYSNETILAEYFQTSTIENSPTNDQVIIIDNTTITDKKYLENQFSLGEVFFKNNDFTKSYEAYKVVLENKNNSAFDLENIDFEAAQWNQILTHLGNEDRLKTLEELEKMATADLSEKYKSEAIELQKKLNSFWYGWAN